LFANEGTLFLDEIGDMPLHLQARLLRVLQERKVNPLGSGREVDVDVTVICATNKNLKDMIANGTFREDLYYRLNGLVVKLPALRDRKDLEVVAKKILASLCTAEKRIEISPDVMEVFHRYAWPGNFRQLYNLLRTAVVMAECEGGIQMHHLPDDFLSEIQQLGPAQKRSDATAPAPAQATMPPTYETRNSEAFNLENVAIDAIAQALRTCKGNVSAAAKLLGVSRNTIYRKKHLLPNETSN
jgi:transcriptional regulator of acetoin/glycerol metabolism